MSSAARAIPKALAERLQRVLLLEQELGHSNKAVPKGLDLFLRNWAEEAERAIPRPSFAQELRQHGLLRSAYQEKSAEERIQWVEEVLRWSSLLGGGLVNNTRAERAARPEPQGARASATTAPPAPRPAPTMKRAILERGQGLSTPVTSLRGVGPYLGGRLAKLGLETVRDLLYFFPRRHIDFSNTLPIARLEPGSDQTVIGSVWKASEVRFGLRARGAAEAIVADESGTVRAIWFNQPYVARSLMTGTRIALSGRVSVFGGRKQFENPEFELVTERELLHTGRMVPVYAQTEGLTSRRIRALLKPIVDDAAELVTDPLPEARRRRLGLVQLPGALRQAHFPESAATHEAARRRLAFDELFLMQLGVQRRKQEWQAERGHPLRAPSNLLSDYPALLPFPLTRAQRRCIDEIVGDLARSAPMSRMLQGEVGSGKTVVALAGALVAVANGQQVAFMAPTEILAEQHFRTVTRLLGGGSAVEPSEKSVASFKVQGLQRPLSLGLLTGSQSRKRKEEMAGLAARGEVDILIGTHALFQRGVEFASLALTIVDEQHRFGVMQRAELRQKGYNPHLLVMTATPIPRTLSLTLYGDLDISVIDELPAGREEIRTRWLEAARRESAYEFIRRQVAEGRQAFIVYPLVEESEKLDAAAAVQEHQRLARDVFPNLNIGLLHGRMKQAEKDDVMVRFRAGEFHVLVSTAVIEVGIDVPNATVMLVESADRFGLAQLHQFRGRVGRGAHESYCMLIAEAPSAEASERLRLMESIHNGFVLAEEDLRLRGPGQFFGTEQSGMPDLRMARLSDTKLLEQARAEAQDVFQQDPELRRAEHQALREAVKRAWALRDNNIGEA